MPRFFTMEDNDEVWRPITKSELEYVLLNMPKDKSPEPDGWTQEFLSTFFYLVGDDLLRVVEDSRTQGRVEGSINSTFIALIPKESNPESLSDYRPISLCNFDYKLISKIIANRIRGRLGEFISSEQFGFLKDRLITDTIGMVRESIHSAKTHKKSCMFLKLDIKKAYDRATWSYLRLILI